MRNIARRSFFACAVIVFSALPTVRPAAEPVLGLTSRFDKTIVLDCSKEWAVSAAGQYGGVAFALSCRNTRDRLKIVGTVGTAYDISVTAEGPVGVRCSFTGDSPTVDVSCNVAARITIR